MAVHIIEKMSVEGRFIADSAACSHEFCDPRRISYVRPFHPVGVTISDIPAALYGGLLAIVQKKICTGHSGLPDDGGGVVASDADLGASCIPQDEAEYVQSVHLSPQIMSLVEAFSGVPVVATEWYGPRIYHRRALLLRHTDRAVTHTFGVTMYIDSSDHLPWPIFFERERDFLRADLRVGQLAIYEGVRLPHFRPNPLEAAYFATAFLHYRPIADNGL